MDGLRQPLLQRVPLVSRRLQLRLEVLNPLVCQDDSPPGRLSSLRANDRLTLALDGNVALLL